MAASCACVTLLWAIAAAADGSDPVLISGRYPHLAMFNHGAECGIGAIAPWAGRLWAVTYSPHQPRGSDDKLYAINGQLQLEAFGGSIGGTPANRLIHRESKQLIIGPYFIDASGNVRVLPYSKAVGRPTATTRHLTDPANKVYLFTMEEGLYEIDVHTLDVNVLYRDSHVDGFVDYLPGYHGKGAYLGPGRLIVANNGRRPGPSTSPHANDDGCLAQWDGRDWQVVEAKQFCEVSGPGGIEGNSGNADPVWTTGWDKCSVILKVLDGGQWHTWRLPFGDYSYVAPHGWYTEWPRIRQVVAPQQGRPARWLMNMHGLWFDFPGDFAATRSGGLRPLGSHLKVTADFCNWDGRIVFACDDTAITGGNTLVNQSQSNLWFSTWDGLGACGRPAGWGGVWLRDDVQADKPSDPLLVAGFDQKVLHLSHRSDEPVRFAIEEDQQGNGRFQETSHVMVAPGEYRFVVLGSAVSGPWIRVRTDREAKQATAYVHYGPGGGAISDAAMFAELADATDAAARTVGIVRPRGSDLGTLQLLAHREGDQNRQLGEAAYYEMGPDMKLRAVPEDIDGAQYLRETAALKGAEFQMDAASVIITDRNRRYRLPKSDAAYDTAWSGGWPRAVRGGNGAGC